MNPEQGEILLQVINDLDSVADTLAKEQFGVEWSVLIRSSTEELMWLYRDLIGNAR